MRAPPFGCCVAVLLSISSAVHAQSTTDDIKAKAQRLAAPLVESRDNRLQSVEFMPEGSTVGSHREPNRH
jgi:hypothetical protein